MLYDSERESGPDPVSCWLSWAWGMTQSLPAHPVPHPCYSLPPPGAPLLGHPLPLSILSSSPSYLSPFLRNLLVDPTLWLPVQRALKHLNIASGPAVKILKWPLPALRCQASVSYPRPSSFICPKAVCAKVCAHDFKRYINKPFFDLTVCINFAVY